MEENFVVTISHQLGCGGAQIGKKLSEALSIPFIDRQILKMAADTYNISEEDIEGREERISSFWETILRMEAFSDPILTAGISYFPSDQEIYGLESQFINKIAKQESAVILGRGGRYILRGHPRHFSVFVCAEPENRIRRIAEQNKIAENEARKLIEQNDRERSAYMKAFTRLDWLNVRNYDLSLNTSSIGIDNAVAMIRTGLKQKLGVD